MRLALHGRFVVQNRVTSQIIITALIKSRLKASILEVASWSQDLKCLFILQVCLNVMKDVDHLLTNRAVNPKSDCKRPIFSVCSIETYDLTATLPESSYCTICSTKYFKFQWFVCKYGEWSSSIICGMSLVFLPAQYFLSECMRKEDIYAVRARNTASVKIIDIEKY